MQGSNPCPAFYTNKMNFDKTFRNSSFAMSDHLLQEIKDANKRKKLSRLKKRIKSKRKRKKYLQSKHP